MHYTCLSFSRCGAPTRRRNPAHATARASSSPRGRRSRDGHTVDRENPLERRSDVRATGWITRVGGHIEHRPQREGALVQARVGDHQPLVGFAHSVHPKEVEVERPRAIPHVGGVPYATGESLNSEKLPEEVARRSKPWDERGCVQVRTLWNVAPGDRFIRPRAHHLA